MSICLIRPPILVPVWNQAALVTPPLGLAYVAGTLDQAGHAVSVIDAVGSAIDRFMKWDNDCLLFGLGPDEIVEQIPADTRVVGVSAGFSFEWPVCCGLIERVRRRFPDALLVVGGEHATAVPGPTLNDAPLDLCVLGEGEETMLDIVNRRLGGDFDPSLIPGIAYRDANGKVCRTPRRERMRDLDAIPWPAWHLLPIEQYLDRHLGFGVDRGRSMPVLASRGCPYQCTFCSSPLMWTTRWDARSVAALLEELVYYQREYRVENFDFYDLTAIVKKSWIKEFCQTIIDRRLEFTWQLPSGTRSEAIDEETAPLLFASGCRNLSYSPESGSPGVLQRIKKRIKPERMLDSMSACVKAGMNIKCNIMLGFPGETWREVGESLRFIAQMAWVGAHDLSIWAFAPYPGSELFETLRSQGHLKLNAAYYNALRSYADISATKSFSQHISDRRLLLVRSLGVLMFYMLSWIRRPWRPFRMLCNALAGRQESRSELALRGFFKRLGLVAGGPVAADRASPRFACATRAATMNQQSD